MVATCSLQAGALWAEAVPGHCSQSLLELCKPWGRGSRGAATNPERSEKLNLKKLFIIICKCMCDCMHTRVHVFIIWVHTCYEAYVEVRGQLPGISSLLAASALESWDGT